MRRPEKGRPRRPAAPRASPSLRWLVAIDGSKHSARVIKYVGEVMRDVHHGRLILFHVLKPVPPELREHGGSEDPTIESRLGKRLRTDREAWYKAERESESKVFKNALGVLQRRGLDKRRISLRFGYDDDIARSILEEARRRHCKTIVVGRHGRTRVGLRLWGSVARRLLRDAANVAVWVID